MKRDGVTQPIPKNTHVPERTRAEIIFLPVKNTKLLSAGLGGCFRFFGRKKDKVPSVKRRISKTTGAEEKRKKPV